MPRMNKLSNYATTIASCGDLTVITYHSTQIVAFDRRYITLRTGGWDSVTTRRKINQAANQFGLGFTVQRDKGTTYVCNRVGRIELGDEVVIDRLHYANVA